MTITRQPVDQMRTAGRLHINDHLAEMIIAQYGVEPELYEYYPEVSADPKRLTRLRVAGQAAI